MYFVFAFIFCFILLWAILIGGSYKRDKRGNHDPPIEEYLEALLLYAEANAGEDIEYEYFIPYYFRENSNLKMEVAKYLLKDTRDRSDFIIKDKFVKRKNKSFYYSKR